MLEKHLKNLEGDLLTAIRECVRIPSVGGDAEKGAPYGAGPRKALDWTLALAEKLGFRTKMVDSAAGWAEIGDGDEMVAVLGHLDVVPEGKGWSVDPWGGELKDGMIWGRGVLDDKGPAITALFAAKGILDSGIPLKRRVRIIFGTNEERGSKCMKRYVELGEDLPAAGFTPDAEYPVIYAEKGILTYTLSLPFAQAGGRKLLSLNGGVASNVVMAEVSALLADPRPEGRKEIVEKAASWKGPERSSLTATENEADGTVLLEMKGHPAHGSTPEKGVNALACLADFLVPLELEGEQGKFFETFSRLLGFETDGSSLGVSMKDDISGSLTACVGVVSMKDKRVTFSVNIRYPVTKKEKEVTGPLLAVLEKNNVTVENLSSANPLYMPPDSRLVTTLRKIYREETGTDPELLAIGGGTYAKTMPNVVAFGPVFPGQTYKIHEEDEKWSVEDILKNLRIMAKVLVELAEVKK